MNPALPESPKARLKTIAAHRMARMPIAKMFCMSMASTFLPRTMPP